MKLVDLDKLPEAYSGSHERSFFNLPEWYRLLSDHGLPAGTRTGFAAMESGEACIAFAQLTGERILRSCTNLYTCDFAIGGNKVNADTTGRLIDGLQSCVGPFDGMRFEGLDPETCGLSSLLEAIRANGFIAKAYAGWANWFEPTAGISFETYLSARPSGLRNTWKRKAASLRKARAAEFRILRKIDDPTPLIEIYEQVRAQSWKSAEPYPGFIPSLIALAARLNALRFGILNLGGVSAAAQFWIVWAGRATIYKLVHASRFDAASPGTLLTMEMIRNVLDADCPHEIDFGRGDDAYKNLWMSSRRRRWGIEAANPRTARGLIHSARIKASLLRHSHVDAFA